MSELLFLARGIPNLIKSAGDIRALKMLKILMHKHRISVIARSADYGQGDAKAIGCKTYLTGDIRNSIKNCLSIKTPEIVIFSHWTVAREHIDFIHQNTKAKVYIDTIDLEFLRLSRKYEYDNKSISLEEVERTKVQELDVYKKANGIIVASETDKQEIVKYGNFNIIMLPCLFDVNNEYKVNDGKNVYIICNWSHEPNLISTKYLLTQIVHNLDVMFYIVGKHPPGDLKEYATSKIIFTGCEYNINKFLSKMNVLLCPIFYGAGMNGKILQAISFGIPVVTTSMGAAPLGLVHRESAMIADNSKDFISCVKEVLSNEELRNKLSNTGREIAKKFTVKHWQDSFLEGIR
jgi:glycosyltransferase involved in cell wall biosynthesis